jgi:hypothetical protein
MVGNCFFFRKEVEMVLCLGVWGVYPPTTLSLERKKYFLKVHKLPTGVENRADMVDARTAYTSTGNQGKNPTTKEVLK